MSEKTFTMYYPGTTDDGKGTYVAHPLRATTREEAKVQAMGVTRALEIKDMHIIENPNELVFFVWPSKPRG